MHLGKTGGTSVSWLLCNTLKPPVFNVFEQKNMKNPKAQGYEFILDGQRHANLPEAKNLLGQYGMRPEDFKLIIILVRNPVDLELSHYRYLRKEKLIKRATTGGANKIMERVIAAKKSFDAFARSYLTHYTGELKDFFTLNDHVPENMEIVRMEEMKKVLPNLLRPFQTRSRPLPHRNKSSNPINNIALSNAALKKIYLKYQWIYDHGFYNVPVMNSFEI